MGPAKRDPFCGEATLSCPATNTARGLPENVQVSTGVRRPALPLPANVTLQNIAGASLGSRRNLDESLARLNMQKTQTLQNLAGLTSQLPPQPSDTSGQDLLSLGLQGLTAGDGTDLDWLKKLLGGTVSGNTFQGSDDLMAFLDQNNAWGVPQSL